MMHFYRYTYCRLLFNGGLAFAIGLGFSCRVCAQQSTDGPYRNLKKLVVPSDSRPLLSVFHIGAEGIGQPVVAPERDVGKTPDLGLFRWSAEDLPFFCRIEHKIGLKMQVPIKFRLGSVEYVDWLEGKKSFEF